MKWVFAFLGTVSGQVIGELADSQAMKWMFSLILGAAGFLLFGFFRYTKLTPKQLLSFHGPDAPISRATSSGELRTFLWQLREGGILLDFNPQKSDAKVDGAQWANLTELEKLTLFQVLAQAKAVDGDSTQDIRLLSPDGTLLAKYSITNKVITQ